MNLLASYQRYCAGSSILFSRPVGKSQVAAEEHVLVASMAHSTSVHRSQSIWQWPFRTLSSRYEKRKLTCKLLTTGLDTHCMARGIFVQERRIRRRCELCKSLSHEMLKSAPRCWDLGREPFPDSRDLRGQLHRQDLYSRGNPRIMILTSCRLLIMCTIGSILKGLPDADRILFVHPMTRRSISHYVQADGEAENSGVHSLQETHTGCI